MSVIGPEVRNGELLSVDSQITLALQFSNPSPSNLAFIGNPIQLTIGTPVLVVDTDYEKYGMLKEYVLCLTPKGFVWIVRPHIALKREEP